MTDDESKFKERRPKLTQVTTVQAVEAYNRGDLVVSLNGKRTAIDAFILSLATETDTFGPYLLNATCARALYALLVAADFGPPKAPYRA